MTLSSPAEKLVSGLGGIVSMLIVLWLTQIVEQAVHARTFFVASMGASAVLLFAAPHSPLSQPWNVVGGHVVSALVGVMVYQQFPDPVAGGALSVGLAITAMYFLGCLHPLGGASALIPLIAGPAISDFGFAFTLFPVGAGAVTMVLIAIVFNYPFKHRRYPAALSSFEKKQPVAKAANDAYPDISHADLVVALAEIGTYVDISEDDLLAIYAIAMRQHLPEERKAKT